MTVTGAPDLALAVRPARRRGSFDRTMWLFTRVSALALLVIGVASMLFAVRMGARTAADVPAALRWTFFPNPNHVADIAAPGPASGWSGPFWRAYGIAILFLAVGHGANGLRMVFEDYVGRYGVVLALRVAILLAWLGGLAMAIGVVLSS